MYKTFSFLFFFSFNVCILLVVSFLTSNFEKNEILKLESNHLEKIEYLEKKNNENKNSSQSTKKEDVNDLGKRIINSEIESINELKVDNAKINNEKQLNQLDNRPVDIQKIQPVLENTKVFDTKNNYIVQYGVYKSDKNLDKKIRTIRNLLDEINIELNLKTIVSTNNFKIVSQPMNKENADLLCKESKIKKIECYVRKK